MAETGLRAAQVRGKLSCSQNCVSTNLMAIPKASKLKTLTLWGKPAQISEIPFVQPVARG